jgi:hypothetical protein
LVANIDQKIANINDIPSTVKEQIIDETKAGNAVRTGVDSQKTLENSLKQQIEKSIPKTDTSRLSPAARKSVLDQMEAASKAIALKFKEIGIQIGDAIKESFAGSINSTIRIASYVTLFGAFIALLLENPKVKPKKKE